MSLVRGIVRSIVHAIVHSVTGGEGGDPPVQILLLDTNNLSIIDTNNLEVETT